MHRPFFVLLPIMLFVLGCDTKPLPEAHDEEQPAHSKQIISGEPDGPLDLQATPPVSEAQILETRLAKIGAAFHQFHEEFGHFPPAASRDLQGKRLLSWRVHLLPFLGHYDLYRQFHLNEPWDSPHNSTLIEEMPAEYLAGEPGQNTTNFVVFLGNECVFGGSKAEEWSRPLRPYIRKQRPSPPTMQMYQSEEEAFAASPRSQKKSGPRMAEMWDGTSNTILVVQGGDNIQVPWTSPEDVPFEPENPIAALGDVPDAGFLALYADGSVRLLSKEVMPAKLAAAITRAGREKNLP